MDSWVNELANQVFYKVSDEVLKKAADQYLRKLCRDLNLDWDNRSNWSDADCEQLVSHAVPEREEFQLLGQGDPWQWDKLTAVYDYLLRNVTMSREIVHRCMGFVYLLFAQDRIGPALTLARGIYFWCERHFLVDRDLTAEAVHVLAQALTDLGRHEEALPIATQAINIYKRFEISGHNIDYYTYYRAERNLAKALFMLIKSSEALPHAVIAVNGLRKLLYNGHTKLTTYDIYMQLAYASHIHGNILCLLGRGGTAQEALQEALGIYFDHDSKSVYINGVINSIKFNKQINHLSGTDSVALWVEQRREAAAIRQPQSLGEISKAISNHWWSGGKSVLLDELEGARCRRLRQNLLAGADVGSEGEMAELAAIRASMAAKIQRREDVCLEMWREDKAAGGRNSADPEYDDLGHAIRELEDSELMLLANSPRLRELLPIRVTELAQLLPPGSVALTYIALDEEDCLLAILMRDPGSAASAAESVPDGIEVRREAILPGDPAQRELILVRIPCAYDALRSTVAAARAAVQTRPKQRRAVLDSAAQAALAAAYDLLLAPLEPWLDNLGTAADGTWQEQAPWRLYIAPGEDLLEVPWAALWRPATAAAPAAGAAEDAASAAPPAGSSPAGTFVGDAALLGIVASFSSLRAAASQAAAGWAAEPGVAAGPHDYPALRRALELADSLPMRFESCLQVANSLAFLQESPDSELRDLGDLPGAETEVERVGGLGWRSAPVRLLREEATLDAFIRAVMAQDYEVIHCPIHADLNSSEIERSRLFFSPDGPEAIVRRCLDIRAANRGGAPPEARSRGELQEQQETGQAAGSNSVLTPLLIYSLIRSGRFRLRCRELWLTACHTGRARGGGSDEFQGFVAALCAAGCAGIVAGLWALDDSMTAELVYRIFLFSRGGRLSGDGKTYPPLAPAEALRAAMRSMRDGRFAFERLGKPAPAPHPFYWAGLVRYGVG